MDAKQACDKLNGFNFQNRYLVGTSPAVLKSNNHLVVDAGKVGVFLSY